MCVHEKGLFIFKNKYIYEQIKLIHISANVSWIRLIHSKRYFFQKGMELFGEEQKCCMCSWIRLSRLQKNIYMNEWNLFIFQQMRHE